MFKVTKIRQSILTAMWGVTSVSTLALANEEIDTGITAEQQAQVVNAKDVKKLSDVIVTAQYRAQNIQKFQPRLRLFLVKIWLPKAQPLLVMF
jgi:iron complex outermembrane receptor protein